MRDPSGSQPGNIGPAQCHQRTVFGLVMLAVAVTATIAVLMPSAVRPWRLLAVVPLWLGVLALLESRSHTCVILAARGTRDLGAGRESVGDPDNRRAHRNVATRLYVQATLVAVLAGVVLILW